MINEGIVMRHLISVDGIKVDPTKTEVILKIPILTRQKEVHNFLGHGGYYRIFIEIFSVITSPLFYLLVKDVDFFWIGKCEQTFIELKEHV